MVASAPVSAGVYTLLTILDCSSSRVNSIASGFNDPSSFKKSNVLEAYVCVVVVFIRFKYGIRLSW